MRSRLIGAEILHKKAVRFWTYFSLLFGEFRNFRGEIIFKNRLKERQIEGKRKNSVGKCLKNVKFGSCELELLFYL